MRIHHGVGLLLSQASTGHVMNTGSPLRPQGTWTSRSSQGNTQRSRILRCVLLHVCLLPLRAGRASAFAFVSLGPCLWCHLSGLVMSWFQEGRGIQKTSVMIPTRIILSGCPGVRHSLLHQVSYSRAPGQEVLGRLYFLLLDALTLSAIPMLMFPIRLSMYSFEKRLR